MTPLNAHALAEAWEQEFGKALFTVPTVEARFALVREFVAHRLEETARAHPECAAFAAAAGELLRRYLRYDAHAEALAALSVPAPATHAGKYCEDLASRPSDFCYYYDLAWAAADLAFEAGSNRGPEPFDPDDATTIARVAAEIEWQRRRTREVAAGAH